MIPGKILIRVFGQMVILASLFLFSSTVLSQIPQRSGSGRLFFDTLKIDLYNPPAWNWHLNCTFFQTEILPDQSMVLYPGRAFSLFNGNQWETAFGIRSVITNSDYRVLNAWKPVPYLRKEHWISRTGRFIIRTIDFFSDYDLEWADEVIYDFGVTYRKEQYFDQIHRGYPSSLYQFNAIPDSSILRKSILYTPVLKQDTTGFTKIK